MSRKKKQKKRYLGKKPPRQHDVRCPRHPDNLARLQVAERSLYRCVCQPDGGIYLTEHVHSVFHDKDLRLYDDVTITPEPEKK